MHKKTVATLVGLTLIGIASCGGGESDDDQRSEQSSATKRDGSRLALCFASADCNEGLTCYGAITESMSATAGFCTDRCVPDDPFAPGAICAPIENHAATCSPEGQCRIECSDAEMGRCPAGMECRDLDPREMETAFRCTHPLGTGRGSNQPWAECDPRRGDAECAAPNVCVPFGSEGNRRGYCSAPCTMDAECTVGGGVTARPLCAASLDACSLDCTDGGSCPAGMECVDASPGQQVTMRCRFVPPEAPTGGEDEAAGSE